MTTFGRTLKVTLPAAVIALAACDTVNTSPTAADPFLAIGDRIGLVDTFDGGIGYVCAFYPDDTPYGPSTFSVSASGGDVISTDFDISLPGPHCIEVWNATDDAAVELTASLEVAAPALEIERVVTLVGDPPDVQNLFGVTSATVDVSDLVGASIWFKFKVGEAPPSGGEGCTPGYWKQEHHFDSWTAPYDPTDLFSSVFDDAFPGETLLDVVWARGGRINALGRHSVAALLNAASPNVEYDVTVQQVIDAFNDAYASGNRAIIEDQKDVFDFLNNQGCGLN